MLIALFGLVWAPIGATICALAARKVGLPARRYAVAGAIYSVLLFLPWMYLLLRVLGRSPSTLVIRQAYVAVYGAWAIGPLAFALTEWIIVEDFAFAVVLPINAVTMLLSILALRGKVQSRPAVCDNLNQAPADLLPDIKYIQPFVLLLFWLVATAIVTFVST